LIIKSLCCNKIIIFFILLISTLSADSRYAFIYSNHLDDRFVNFYDKVVVDAEVIDNIYARRYPKKMVAYISVGEIDVSKESERHYDPSWVISQNKTWNTLVVDLTSQGYQSSLFQKIEKVYKKGYRNFFLDTIDAYHITSENQERFKKQQNALIGIIHKLHQKYPESKIITNRGFEILDKIHNDISAVAVESLMYGYNHEKKAYKNVPERDRLWILEHLKRVKKYGLDAIAIEYSDQRSEVRNNMAEDIRALGVIPYVTDGMLLEQGECDVKRVRREVLVLYQEYAKTDDNHSIESDIHHTLPLPIEYWGYVPHLYDLSKKALPQSVVDRYHAVIVWGDEKLKRNEKLFPWIEERMAEGTKVLFFGDFPFNVSEEKLQKLGMSQEKNSNDFMDKTESFYPNDYDVFEQKASIDYEAYTLHADEVKEIVNIGYANGQRSTVIGVTPWGGYALRNAFYLSVGDETYWTIDPYKFIKEALALEEIPMPDPTTEAGRRILFIHLDGDGFMEPVRIEKDKLSMEYLIDNIFLKYKVPQSISVIEGEIEYLYPNKPKLIERMRKITKRLYSIPWIEPASHTLSHPFFWKDMVAGMESADDGKLHHLKLKGYNKLNLKKETIGSVNYVRAFSKASKHQEKMLFWSGDCQPPKEVLAYVEREGILAINGGDTTINKSNPTLSYVAPFGIQREDYWQVYTAQQNENVFTNDWLGPFWAYRKVIETFKMTEKPHRIKPINIYYHTYAASKLAAFNALKEVYEWALNERTSKLYTSQYIKKTTDFYRTVIAKVDGGFELRNSGELRTVRFGEQMEIDIKSSRGVAGYIYENGQTYVTLDTRGEYFLSLGTNSDAPHLIDANGWVERVTVDENRYTFQLKANVPLESKFYLPSGCQVEQLNRFKKIKKEHRIELISESKKGATVVFKCQ
jgi:hypothetical protein